MALDARSHRADRHLGPASASRASYLGHQGDAEIRWAPAPHVLVALNVAAFSPGAFVDALPYHHAPFGTNLGVTFRL
jgi:hypothetical protein